MSYSEPTSDLHRTDAAPGDQRLDRAEIAEGIKSYLVGLGLSILLTVMSFFISGTTLVWGPSIPVALVVLAIAQMGVHLVFFLHITTAPDNVNNVLALAFGVLIVLLVLAGSLWIMAHLNYNMKPMDQMMPMQLERGPGARAITAKGVVGPATAASVGTRVSGVIEATHCNASMQVKAGQLCAKIDPYPYQIVVDQGRAELAAAEAQLEKDKVDLAQAKAALESHEALAKRPAISRKAIGKLRRAFERAQTQTKRDEARVVAAFVAGCWSKQTRWTDRYA
jgi:cytochrome o ubiquinol oxidase subunit IV